MLVTKQIQQTYLHFIKAFTGTTMEKEIYLKRRKFEVNYENFVEKVLLSKRIVSFIVEEKQSSVFLSRIKRSLCFFRLEN